MARRAGRVVAYAKECEASVVVEHEKFTTIAGEVARLTGFARQDMRLKTRVYQDAGLAGVDYADFLIWFSNEYAVDLTGLDLSKLAPGEGSALGTLLPKRFLEVTIQDFIELSEGPSWEASGLSKRASRK
jgi:hypothetical protein